MDPLRASPLADGHDPVAERAVRAACPLLNGSPRRSLRCAEDRRPANCRSVDGLASPRAVAGLLPQCSHGKPSTAAGSRSRRSARRFASGIPASWTRCSGRRATACSRCLRFSMSALSACCCCGVGIGWPTLAALHGPGRDGLPQRRGPGLVGRLRVWRTPLRRDAAVLVLGTALALERSAAWVAQALRIVVGLAGLGSSPGTSH